MSLLSFLFGDKKELDSKDAMPFENLDSYSKKRYFFEKAGFIGNLSISQNSNYILLWASSLDFYENGDLKFKRGRIALFEKERLLFTKTLNNPNFVEVNNQGTLICPDWLSQSQLGGQIFVFDKYGNKIYEIKLEENIGYGFLSEDSKFAVFDSSGPINEAGHRLYILNIESKKYTFFNYFIRYQNAIIDSKNEKIILIDDEDCRMELDFDGKEVNDNYLKQLIEKKSLKKLLFYFRRRLKETNFNDENYLKFLLLASDSNDNFYYSNNLDKLYKEIGDYYEYHRDFANAISYWDKAISINSKIGLIRKVKELKSKHFNN